LLNIAHPDDHALLKQQLIPKDLHTLFAAKSDENGEIRSRTKEEEDEIDLKLREDRRDFQIRCVYYFQCIFRIRQSNHALNTFSKG
jgi:hypothetical protein